MMHALRKTRLYSLNVIFYKVQVVMKFLNFFMIRQEKLIKEEKSNRICEYQKLLGAYCINS